MLQRLKVSNKGSTSVSSQPPVTTVPKDPTPTSVLHRHSHVCDIYRDTHIQHKHINKNKS